MVTAGYIDKHAESDHHSTILAYIRDVEKVNDQLHRLLSCKMLDMERDINGALLALRESLKSNSLSLGIGLVQSLDGKSAANRSVNVIDRLYPPLARSGSVKTEARRKRWRI